MIDDEAVAQPVEFAGRDPGTDIGRDEVERRRGEHAGAAHAFERVGAVDLDLAAARRSAPKPGLVAGPVISIALYDLMFLLHVCRSLTSARRFRTGNPIRPEAGEPVRRCSPHRK